MTDLRKLIDEGLALCDGATPGPWEAAERQLPMSDVGNLEFPGGLPATYERAVVTTRVHPQLRSQIVITPLCTSPYFVPQRFVSIEPADAALIAFAGTHLRTLLTALRDQDAALRGLVEELRREADRASRMAGGIVSDRQEASYLGSAASKRDAADRIEKIREGK